MYLFCWHVLWEILGRKSLHPYVFSYVSLLKMDIFLHNHNDSVISNKINSNFLVLRIHSNPYSTFNDCLKNVFF